MGKIVGNEMREEWRTYQFLVKAYKSLPVTTSSTEGYEKLKTIVRRIEWDIEPEESYAALVELFQKRLVDAEDLALIIERDLIFPSKTAVVVADILAKNGFFSSEEELLRKLMKGIG